MKRVLSASLFGAVLAVSSAAFADEPAGTSTDKGVPLPQQQAPTQQQQVMPPQQPTSTTTVTQADVAATTPSSTPMPQTARAQEKDTVTLYQSVRPNKTYLYTGGLLFLGAYVPTAVLTGVNSDSDRTDKSLYIPAVGPWLTLADRNCTTCTEGQNTLDTVLIAGSGVIQGAGLLLMTASIFVPEKVPAATIQAGNVKMTPTATSVGRSSATFGVVGTF